MAMGEPLTFGVDLWDKYDEVTERVDDGLRCSKDLASFISKVLDAETNYAKAIDAAVVSALKEKRTALVWGTHRDAYITFMENLNSLSTQHSEFARKLAEPLSELEAFVKTAEKTNSELVKAAKKQIKNLTDAQTKMAKAEKTRNDTSADAEDKEEVFSRAQTAQVLKASKIQKLGEQAAKQRTKANNADEAFRTALDTLNTTQRDHHYLHFPTIMDGFMDLETRRLQSMETTLATLHNLRGPIADEYERTMAATQEVISDVVVFDDIQLYIGSMKTGDNPPDDVPYYEFGEIPSTRDVAPPAGAKSKRMSIFSSGKSSKRNSVSSMTGRTSRTGSLDSTASHDYQSPVSTSVSVGPSMPAVAEVEDTQYGSYGNDDGLGDGSHVTAHPNEMVPAPPPLATYSGEVNYVQVEGSAGDWDAGAGATDPASEEWDGAPPDAAEGVDTGGGDPGAPGAEEYAYDDGYAKGGSETPAVDGGDGYEAGEYAEAEAEFADDDFDYYAQPSHTVRATYPYAGDVEDDLPFEAGDIITVFGEPDYDGWYRGELNGKRGMVPSNYTEPM